MSLRRIVALAMAILFALWPVADAAAPTVVRHGPRGVRTVALSIDDGWAPARCEAMRQTLVEAGVPATWFPNAIYVKRAPALWRRIAQDFPIGNHTYSHPDLTRLSSAAVRRQIDRDQRVIEAITGQPMARLLRPPFGAFDHRVRRVARELGYETLVLWGASDGDSSPRTTVRSGLRAASRGAAGSIILMHCGPAVTPEILPALIRHYACAGYRFVTVEGLAARDRGAEARVDCTSPDGQPAAGTGGAAPGAVPGSSEETPDPADKVLVTELASLTETLLAYAAHFIAPGAP